MNNANQNSTISIKQRHFPFGIRELILDGQKTLNIKERSLFRQDTTKIPLEVLQGSPASSQTFSLKWLLNSIALIALSIFVYWFAEKYTIPLLHIITLIVVAFTVYSIYQFFINTTDLVIYRNAYTNEHYLYLWNNSPNKKEFQAFLDILNQRIDGFIGDKASSPSAKIELYSQHLAFLHKEKIIDDSELSKLSRKIYEKALAEAN